MINKHQRKVKQTLTLKDIYSYLKLQNNIQKLEQLEILKEVVYNLYLVADTYCSSNPHQVTQAGFAGAVVGTKVNGGSWSQTFSNGVKGAIAGAVTAGVGEYAKGLEAFQKIMVQSGASGISSEIMGGSFKDGFKMGLVTSSARYLYESVVKYKATWESGGDAVNKTVSDAGIKGANNIGTYGKVDKNSWFGEGGRVSRALNQVPGVNAVAGFHDNMQVWFDTVTKSSDGVLRSVMNIPAMIPAVAVTYSALAFEHRNAIIIYRNIKERSR